MSSSDIVSSAEQFLDLAKKAGADAADVLAVNGTSVQVRVRNGATDKVERSEAVDFGLRVFVNGSSAVVSGTARTAQDYATLAERAVQMAKIAPSSSDRVLQFVSPPRGAEAVVPSSVQATEPNCVRAALSMSLGLCSLLAWLGSGASQIPAAAIEKS